MFEFETKEAAEAASNAMFLLKNPEGTTELLYGHMIVDGKYVLQGVDDRFQFSDGSWKWVEGGAPVENTETSTQTESTM